MKVADLYAELSARGDLAAELDRVETALRSVGQRAGTTERDIRQIQIPTNLRRDGQQAERTINDLSEAGQRTARQLRGIEIPETARTSARQTARAVDDIADSARTAQRESSGIGGALRESIREGAQGAQERGQAGGGAFVAGFGSKVAALGGKAGPIGAALIAVVGLGVVAGKQLADAVLDGMDQQKDRDFSQQKFGLSDAQMKAAGQAAGGAFGNAWGDSVQENINSAGIGIQSGLIKPGASAAEMQPLIEKLQMTSELLGTEIPETAKSAGQMIRTGLVKDGAGAFDLLVSAQQKGLNISDDLLETVNEYGTQWRKLGIDGPTALGTIAQMTKAGARDTDIAADALKEFSIRALDGSESSQQAFKDLGLDVDETINAFGKGGPAAMGMSQTVIMALKKIDDPRKRNAIGVALLGTQWEDLGKAIDSLDLSSAASEMGLVDGAAQRAADGMNNGANSIQAAKNQITMAANEMKIKLGQAFAPMVMAGAGWVVDHKAEILAFFLDVGDAALGLMVNGAKAASGLLRAWASSGGQIVKLAGYIVEAFGTVGGNLGKLLKHVPGMKGIGEALEVAGTVAVKASKGMEGAADGANKIADAIDGKMVPALEAGRRKFNETREASAAVDNAMKGLEGQIVTMPDGKTITVKDNTPETRKNLSELGLTVTTLPDGRLSVTAQTDTAKAALAELQKPLNATLDIKARVANILGQPIDMSTKGVGSLDLSEMNPEQRKLFGRADGGEEPMAPDQATVIHGKRRMQVAEDETGGEFYIPKSSGKRARSTAVLGNAADHFGLRLVPMADGGETGYGLPPGSTGGFPDWVTALGKQYGVMPSTYAGHQESNRNEAGYAANPQGLNRGVDWGGTPAQRLAFAKAMIAQAKSDPAIEQVIYQDPTTGEKFGWHGRSPDADGSYFASDYPGHTDHVHIRFGSKLGAGKAAAAGGPPKMGPRTIPLVKNPDGTYTSSDPAWAALMKRESGGKADIVQQISDVNSGGNEASGLFQIAKGTWAGNGGTEFAATAGQATPEEQAIVAARIFDKSGGSPWGAGLAGREDEAALRAGIKAMPIPGAAADDTAKTAGSSSSSVANVFVTGGKLDGATSPTTPAKTTAPVDERKPTARFGVALYNGGGEVHPGDDSVSGFGPDTVPMLGQVGEHMTRKTMALKHRSLLRAIDEDRVERHANGGTVGGGFGGYTTAGAKYHKAYNWYDALAGGVGAAFGIASGFGDDGSFKGFETGSTSVPGTNALIDRLTKIAEKPTVVIEHAEITAKDPQSLVKSVTRINPATAEVNRRNL